MRSRLLVLAFGVRLRNCQGLWIRLSRDLLITLIHLEPGDAITADDLDEHLAAKKLEIRPG